MAVRDSYNEKPGSWTRDASPIAAVMGISMMGIFVLLIACFNLTNTAVAISSRRLKEIGIRKVMGSTRAHLIFQFIGETAFICLLALVVGILIADVLLIPAFNRMWPDLKLVADYFGRHWLSAFHFSNTPFYKPVSRKLPGLLHQPFSANQYFKRQT
ncbi:MAG: FtsX-like permease family protein [Flammeovirgaceae bacterium]|nr:FtsX-like permease family protein [Flammeovirgaceae bacterium]